MMPESAITMSESAITMPGIADHHPGTGDHDGLERVITFNWKARSRWAGLRNQVARRTTTTSRVGNLPLHVGPLRRFQWPYSRRCRSYEPSPAVCERGPAYRA